MIIVSFYYSIGQLKFIYNVIFILYYLDIMKQFLKIIVFIATFLSYKIIHFQCCCCFYVMVIFLLCFVLELLFKVELLISFFYFYSLTYFYYFSYLLRLIHVLQVIQLPKQHIFLVISIKNDHRNAQILNLNIFSMAHKHVDNVFHFNTMNKSMYDQYIFNQHIPLTMVKFNDFIYHMLDIEYYLNIME